MGMEQFREVIATRNGFLKFSVIVVGAPVAICVFLVFLIEGAPGLAFIMAAVMLGAGYLWGIVFWATIAKTGAERYHARKAKRLENSDSESSKMKD